MFQSPFVLTALKKSVLLFLYGMTQKSPMIIIKTAIEKQNKNVKQPNDE